MFLLEYLKLSLSASANLNLWSSFSLIIFSVHEDCFHSKIVWIKLLQIVFVNCYERYKEYNSCLISYLSFSELFLVFNWAKDISNLLNIQFGVSIFNPCPSWFLFYSGDSSFSKSGISVLSGFSSWENWKEK